MPATLRSTPASTNTIPRANGMPSVPTTSTVSPSPKRPAMSTTPAGSRLVWRSTRARRAPSSTVTDPATREAKAIHSLRAAELAAVGLEARADAVVGDGPAEHAGSRRAGDHRAHARPRGDAGRLQLARHAAAAPAAAAAAGVDRQHRVVDTDPGDQLGVGVHAWVGGVQALQIGEQHEHGGTDVVGDEGGEAVVVAVADLVAGDGVVLVDDRHRAQRQQARQRAPGMEVLPAVDEVVGHEQGLRRHQAVGAEGGVPAAHQARLAGGRQGLQRRHVGRTLRQTRGPPPPPRRRPTTRRSPRDRRPRRSAISSASLRIAAVVDGAMVVGDRRRARP